VEERIEIELPDAAHAAYLMQRFVGGFRARLIESASRWQIVVEADPEPVRELTAVLDVVQHWVGEDETRRATIRFRDRVHTIGPRASALSRHELAPVG
jgi:hypothetical protein